MAGPPPRGENSGRMPTETGDFIEIFLLFLLLYFVLKFMQGTIAGTFVRGVGFLLMLAVVSAMLALSSFGLEIFGAIFKYLLGVSVIAPTGMDADALASTLSVLGPEAGLKLIEQIPNAHALIVTLDENDEVQIFASCAFPTKHPPE